jgi:O-antigen ligase
MPYVLNLVLLPLLTVAGWSLIKQPAALKDLLKQQKWLLCWLGLCLVAGSWSPDLSRHFYGWLIHLASFAGLYLFLRLHLNSDLKTQELIDALLLGSLGICLLGWVQYLNYGLIIRSLRLPPSDGLWSFYLVDLVMIPVQHAHARVYSLFYAPPMYGVYLALLLPLSLYRLQQADNRRSRLLWALVLFLLLSNLVLSFTRIAWIAALVSCGVYLLRYGNRRLLQALLTGTGVLGVISFCWPPLWQHAWERLQSISSLSHYSNAGRLEIWQQSWQAIQQHWLTGYGLLSFWKIFPQWRWQWPHSHSLLLQQLLETGLLACLAFYVWLSQLIRQLPTSALAWACGCSILSWLITGWADYPAHEPRNQFVFWSILALAAHTTTAPCEPGLQGAAE